ncbi:MAG: phosphatidylserine decarboxylase [Candidatus Woesearchaeota archaeon]
MVVLLIISLILFYMFWFLRNPEINIPKGNCIDYFISPADGKVVEIIEFDEETAKIKKGRFGKIMTSTKNVAKEGYIICIAMNIFNVHYQRSPIDGVVKNVSYKKGKFRNVLKDAKSLRFIDNERNEVLIESVSKSKFNVKVIQIAGLVARRIHWFVSKGQMLSAGDIIGLIKLGSMVVLIIPEKISSKYVNLLVKEGQKVKVGETKIAVLGKTNNKK